MPAKFELYKDKKGAFRFRLKAANGEIILASQGYQRKSNAMNGIESVRRNALDNSRYEVKAAKGGQHIFNLKAANAKVIGTSQRYKTKAACENGIGSVKKNAPKAKVDDLTA